MLKEILSKYKIILASKSPRRQFLLKELGLDFEIRVKEVDESFPENLRAEKIAVHLCRKKADVFRKKLNQNELLITADTIVWINNKILNKPADEKKAVSMLKTLSGKMHRVFTAVCIATDRKEKTFFVKTKVYFKKLSDKEIKFYVKNFQPFDKAGAYGAQECLPAGMNPCSSEEIKFLKKIRNTELIEKSKNQKMKAEIEHIIKKIDGSYFNVMGLPMKELYEELIRF
ncbi:MAG: Maf family nucleotide pyrophosphatase [Bacteroidota bacterium]